LTHRENPVTKTLLFSNLQLVCRYAAAASQAAWNEVMKGVRKSGGKDGSKDGSMLPGQLDLTLQRVKATEVGLRILV
jgi:hypothetical protein